MFTVRTAGIIEIVDLSTRGAPHLRHAIPADTYNLAIRIGRKSFFLFFEVILEIAPIHRTEKFVFSALWTRIDLHFKTARHQIGNVAEEDSRPPQLKLFCFDIPHLCVAAQAC